jgi:taurine dioxygenase
LSKTREDHIKGDGTEEARRAPRGAHPPETGRKALYVNLAHAAGIKGLSERRARLLQFLFAHQAKPEFTCRFVWAPDAIAFWDNRCTQHNPVNDYRGFRRVMQRIMLRGKGRCDGRLPGPVC